MELVYLYIEKFKNIENQGFNFNPRYTFLYDKDLKELTFTENKYNLGENFFGSKIGNITALVGANGSGKTNLIEAILLSIGMVINQDDFVHFAIIKKKGKFLQYNSNIYIEKLPKNVFPRDIPSSTNLNYQSIFYSPIIDGFSIAMGKAHRFYNISSNYEILDKESIGNYTLSEIQSILNFLGSDHPLIEKEFILPDKIIIEENVDDKFLNFGKKIDQGFYSQFVKKLISNRLHDQKTRLLKIFIVAIIMRYDSTMSIGQIELNSNIIRKYQNSKNVDDLRDLIWSILENDMFGHSELSKKELDEIFGMLKISPGEKKSIDEAKRLAYLFGKLSWFKFPFKFNWYFNDKSARISAGQWIFLTMFARLYSVFANSKDLPTTIILDEPDLGLHPKWQKMLLKYLIDFLESDMCPINNINIIISSHSPFITSDLLKENVIYLGGESNQKTFAANIHDLLEDSFFMDDGFIGEFAQDKLEEVIDHLTTLDKEIPIKNVKNPEQYCRILIDQVGEPLIYEQLNHMYNDKYPNDDKQEIERLSKLLKEKEERIKRMEDERNI